MAQTRIKRVKLNNSSRKGYFFRVYNPDTKKTAYYKVAGKQGTKTTDEALTKFRARPRKIKLKVPKQEIEETEEYEDATLHFRIDYDSSGAGSRFHHQFLMKDSHITAQVPKNMSDEEVQRRLAELFEEAFAQEFGAPLSSLIEQDLVSGLERGNGRSDEIQIRYAHAKGRAFQTITKSVGSVEKGRIEKEKFFQSIGREKK